MNWKGNGKPNMILKNFLIIPHENIKICYFNECGIYKKSSDLHISAFTEQGLIRYQDILRLCVDGLDQADRVVYLRNQLDMNEKWWSRQVNEFWSLFNLFGAYRLDGDYKEKEQVIPKSFYQLHKTYFTFTDDVIGNAGLFV